MFVDHDRRSQHRDTIPSPGELSVNARISEQLHADPCYARYAPDSVGPWPPEPFANIAKTRGGVVTTSTLYFFVDTNLFIQCHPLQQLDWSRWRGFEQVRLIVSSPVMHEIDRLKTRGGRVGKRARAASAMFREMLGQTHKLVHDQSPRVVLSVEPQHTPTLDLTERLNYQERDHQLLGTVHAFGQSNPTSDVRLLTHDTIPLYTAQGLDLTADQIPDDWLLPPETTETERKMAALQAENTLLKAAEPSFSIHCEDQSDTTVERYHASYTWYEPLTEAEVHSLMQRLKARFPLATDFGSREPAERPAPPTVANRLFSTRQVFTPATDEEIEKYRDEDYPRWLERCEETLRAHHRTLQAETPVLGFAFLAENSGTRPAADALVTIEARGGFEIRPPPFDDTDEDREGEDKASGSLESGALPPPPVAPRGRWKNTVGGQPGDVLRTFSLIGRSMQDLSGIANPDPHILTRPLAIPSFDPPDPRDPNAFHYKPRRPAEPQASFALECAQWRHDNEAATFFGEIHVPTDRDAAEGLLVCRIQAANLSKSVSCRIPVRIAIAHVSALESARGMVEALDDTLGSRIASSRPWTDRAD